MGKPIIKIRRRGKTAGCGLPSGPLGGGVQRRHHHAHRMPRQNHSAPPSTGGGGARVQIAQIAEKAAQGASAARVQKYRFVLPHKKKNRITQMVSFIASHCDYDTWQAYASERFFGSDRTDVTYEESNWIVPSLQGLSAITRMDVAIMLGDTPRRGSTVSQRGIAYAGDEIVIFASELGKAKFDGKVYMEYKNQIWKANHCFHMIWYPPSNWTASSKESAENNFYAAVDRGKVYVLGHKASFNSAGKEVSPKRYTYIGIASSSETRAADGSFTLTIM